MKGTFQIVDHASGRRSKPFVCEAQELADMLKDQEDLPLEDYVLLIARVGDEEFATAPLISIKNFIMMHDIEWAAPEETEENA